MSDTLFEIYAVCDCIFATYVGYKMFSNYKATHAVLSTGPASEIGAWIKVFGVCWFIAFLIGQIPYYFVVWIFG